MTVEIFEILFFARSYHKKIRASHKFRSLHAWLAVESWMNFLPWRWYISNSQREGKEEKREVKEAKR
jgi:hypothetical protein